MRNPDPIGKKKIRLLRGKRGTACLGLVYFEFCALILYVVLTSCLEVCDFQIVLPFQLFTFG